MCIADPTVTVSLLDWLANGIRLQSGPSDLTLNDGFLGGVGEGYVLQRANEQWLSALSAVTVPSLNVVDDGDNALRHGGLQRWGQSCDALHCNEVFDATNEDQGRACTVLPVCELDGTARVVGYTW